DKELVSDAIFRATIPEFEGRSCLAFAKEYQPKLAEHSVSFLYRKLADDRGALLGPYELAEHLPKSFIVQDKVFKILTHL
ncbi:hypothetical protein BGZ54_005435, partial [Gamsiella multidivaricata]